MRVVSLVPSSTETLLALGADVVACSRFCEQPDLPHVGGTKTPDIEAIVALSPDLVVLDREENRIDDHDALVAAGLDVVVTDVVDLAGALDVVGVLADAAGVARRLEDGALALPPAAVTGTRRSAFVPIWRRPWMTISEATYGGSLLEHLGIDLIAVEDRSTYPTVELDEVAAASPELVIVPSEPYEFGPAHLDELRRVAATATIVEVDGQDLFWWGIRTGGAISRLSAALGLRPTV